MAPNNSDFRTLVSRVRSGDALAAAELLHSYRPQIQRIVRVRLTSPTLRRHMNSRDICQSVFADVFVRLALGGQYDFTEPRELIALLARMACNRVVHHAAAQKLRREGRSWTEIAALWGRTLDAVRVQHNRAMLRICAKLGLDADFDG